MNVHKNDITVICTGGDDQLGGKNWDEALMDYVAERYQEEYGVDILEDEEMMSTLYVDVENWKESPYGQGKRQDRGERARRDVCGKI